MCTAVMNSNCNLSKHLPCCPHSLLLHTVPNNAWPIPSDITANTQRNKDRSVHWQTQVHTCFHLLLSYLGFETHKEQTQLPCGAYCLNYRLHTQTRTDEIEAQSAKEAEFRSGVKRRGQKHGLRKYANTDLWFCVTAKEGDRVAFKCLCN